MSPNCDIGDDVALFHCKISNFHICISASNLSLFDGSFLSSSVVKWDTVQRVLPTLQFHRNYHQRVKQANESEHPIIWLILVDHLTPMR